MGAIVTFTPKKLAALLMSEFWPVACIFTKFIVFLNNTSFSLNWAVEDYALYEPFEEELSLDRSTKRQLSQLHSILSDQHKRENMSLSPGLSGH